MPKITLMCAIAFSMVFSHHFQTTQAQLRAQLTAKDPDPIPNQLDFKQPDYNGDAPSGRDRGTGSRGDCKLAAAGTKGQVKLIPLIPTDSRGLTTKQSPTLWFQVTYTSNQIAEELSGELSVEDAQTFSKLPPQTMPVKLPKGSGVFGVPLSHSLEVNKWYRWYLILGCNSPDSSESDSVMFVQGMVKRVELGEVENQLGTKSSSEQVKVYAQQGIWYDALDETAQLSCSEEKNGAITQSWQILLRDDQVGLDEISQTPLICLD